MVINVPYATLPPPPPPEMPLITVRRIFVDGESEPLVPVTVITYLPKGVLEYGKIASTGETVPPELKVWVMLQFLTEQLFGENHCQYRYVTPETVAFAGSLTDRATV